MNKLFMICVFTLTLSACGGCGQGSSKSKGPGLLIIGDSISIGYTPHLRAQMPEFNVRRVNESADLSKTENCQNTVKTLARLEAWLSQDPNNAVITWNNGNWNARDMSTYSADSPNPEWVGTSLEQYESDLIKIGTRLVKTGAKVFFITTTSTIPGNPLYIQGRAEAENEVAKRVLPALGIRIIDLYAFQLPHTDWFIAPDNVHFTDAASAQLAGYIAKEIRAVK